MAKASQVVLLENEFYLIKAPNGKVLEIKNFNTENGAAIRLWDYAGHPWQQWQFVDAGEGRWRIRNRFTGKFIALALGGVVEGTWLHQWGRSGMTARAAIRNGTWCALTPTPHRPTPVPRKSGTRSPRPPSASTRMIWCGS